MDNENLDKYIVKTNQVKTKPVNGYNIVYSESANTNRDLIEKLVLIDSSGKLDGSTELLKEYLYAARELNLISRYEKIQRVFENIYARHSSLLPIVIDAF